MGAFLSSDVYKNSFWPMQSVCFPCCGPFFWKFCKEYKNDILIFEGEYLNGERNGKGKEYYDNGKLRYEGEYLNGIRNGKGKE